jgi:LytS/YehU family sensor histidine kinase
MQFRINGVVQQSALHFILDKPWYKQIWFILLAGVLGSLLILLVYKVRMRKVIQAKLLLLEKDHMERDLRHSMLSSLKSQMNPHFIFNALNTIQSFIHNEEKQNAYIYLSKFSKLTRRILEMSDMPSITLREETETLVLYLEFEKMRFHDLQYSLTIDPNLDLDMTHLPSMIIQPYVENAIKHGLLHKKENKQLMLSCTKVNPQSLLIVIDDHGIGRARSMEINQSKRNKPNSFATQATAKRIALLKQDPKYKSIALEIIDKYDEQGEPTGTTVRIQLPIT